MSTLDFFYVKLFVKTVTNVKSESRMNESNKDDFWFCLYKQTECNYFKANV